MTLNIGANYCDILMFFVSAWKSPYVLLIPNTVHLQTCKAGNTIEQLAPVDPHHLHAPLPFLSSTAHTSSSTADHRCILRPLSVCWIQSSPVSSLPWTSTPRTSLPWCLLLAESQSHHLCIVTFNIQPGCVHFTNSYSQSSAILTQ